MFTAHFGMFCPSGGGPLKLISFYHRRREMGSPLPLHIPVPALGVRLLLLAAGGVHSGFHLIQLHQVLPDGLVLGVVPLVLVLAPLLSLAV